MLSEKIEASYSSQHGDAIGCSLSPSCKFEINLRLFAIWLVAMKWLYPQIHRAIISMNFIATSQIANNLRLISNLQYRLNEYPIASLYVEKKGPLLSY